MATYTTSGGDFGGQDHELLEDQNVLNITYMDENDRKWIASYELRTVDENDTKQLIYIGRKRVGS